LVMFIHGAVSYSMIAVAYIVAFLSKPTFSSLLLTLYLILSLWVIAIHLVKLYENVSTRKTTDKGGLL
jgi:hypothetical protein